MSHVEAAIAAIPRERRMRLAATLAECSDPLLRALGMDLHVFAAREDAEFAEIQTAYGDERRRVNEEIEAQLPPLPPYVKETDE